MTWVNDLKRVNGSAVKTIRELAELFPEESAGLVRRQVDEAATQLRALGPAGRLAAGALRLTAGLAQAGVLTVGVLWATVGSLVMMSKTSGLGWGLLAFFVNAGVTVLVLGYVYHLVTPRNRRDVFGSAAFSTEREAAERAGLSSSDRREGRP